MDGTTAGRLELARPAPRPTPPPSDGSFLGAVHDPSVSSPPPAPTQPQFSQLTPVYAATPANTPADIPQPPVKGIEFVQAPTPTPVVVTPPTPIIQSRTTVTPSVVVDQPFKPQAPILPPTPLATNSPADTNLPPATPTPSGPPMPPMPPLTPTPFTPPEEPKRPEPTQEVSQDPAGDAVEQSMNEVDNLASIATIEKHLDSVDIDQKVNAKLEQQAAPAITSEPPTPEEPVTPAVEPAVPEKVEEVRSYFQNTFNGGEPSATPPTTPIGGGGGSKFSFGNLNPKTVRLVAIIAAIVLIVGVGGFFAIGAIMNGQKSDDIAIDKTPIVETPSDDEEEETPIVETPIVEEEEEEPTTPIFTPEPTPTPTPTPTPVASPTVPTVANSGLNDADIAAQPRYLRIAKLSVNAHVEHIGVTSSGAMGVPSDMWNAGWYVGSAKPGQGGAVFMDGHSTASRSGLFGHLDTLVAGDELEVQRNDGQTIKYRVAKIKIVNRNDVDMAAMMLPYDLSKNGLNILSCTGQWIESEQTLENRVMVFALQV